MTLHSNDESMGTVTGGGQFEDGAQASINATAKPGYHFDSWSDGVTSRERNIVLDSDMTLTANYTNPYSYGDE